MPSWPKHDGYLVKPINTQELFASIESALYKKRKLDFFMEQQAASNQAGLPVQYPYDPDILFDKKWGDDTGWLGLSQSVIILCRVRD